MYKIEKDVQLPNKSAGEKYPLSEMQVGDSFLVGDEKANAVRVAVHHRQRGLNAKFIVRKVDGGYRCWRIE